jgi:hypothetical protein
MKAGLILFVAGTFLSSICSSGTILFNQDFSAGGTLSQYIGSGPGKWDAFGTSSGMSAGISSGALVFTRTAGTGSFSRSTDLSSPAPDSLIYRFDLNVTGNTASANNAATWQVGSGFGTANQAESVSFVHSRFGINLTGTPTMPNTFQFIDQKGGAPTADFKGSQAMTWILNNSGKTLSYQAPNNTVQTVANDSWDLWAGTTRVFDDISAETATRSLTDLKFAYTGGNGSIVMDNFEISTVPEPRWTGLLAVGFVGLVVLCRRVRNSRVTAGAEK